MSPRLDVGEVSIANEGSAPCPPGRTMSEPNNGLPPADRPAAAPGAASTAANETAAISQPSRRTDRAARIIPSSLVSAAPPLLAAAKISDPPQRLPPGEAVLTVAGGFQTQRPTYRQISQPLPGGICGFAARLQRPQKDQRCEHRDPDHGPHGGVAVRRAELAVEGVDDGADRDRSEHEAETAREVLQSGRGTLAPERGERKRERLRQRHQDRACECDER